MKGVTDSVKTLSVAIILLFCFAKRSVSTKKYEINKAAIDLIEKEIKRLEQENSICKLAVKNKRNIDKLRLEKQFEQAAACLVSFLDVTKDEGWAWSALGDIYSNKKTTKSTSVANTCFKQAAKLSGKISGDIKEWHYLGPFVIGKMEIDGDPVEFYGGIRNVSAGRLKKGTKFFSELAQNGEIKWTTFKQDSTRSYIDITPKINWNDLVNSLGSTGITEWQGWIVGEFIVNESDLDVIIRCLGVHTVYVDDIPITGDVYSRETYWYSVSLKRGYHNLYIRLRAKAQQLFRCEIKQAKSSLEIHKPHFMPDIWDGYLFSGYIPLPVTNQQCCKWLRIHRISLQEQSEGESLSVRLIGDKSVNIAPGQTLPIRLLFEAKNSQIIKASCDSIDLKIKVSTSEGSLVYPLSLRCRQNDESFIFTFLDHDGSIQHGAGIRPIKSCSDGVCPILLTLHGTTVPAQNQADSYKRMEDNKFVFGADHAWLVAPTRHGAHNWEGPGALTAMTAAQRFCERVHVHDWIHDKASCDHVIFAGHSMGGHGAWHLATHFPDKALALVSLAGWIKKEEYGDSNLFFRHDIATSHVDPAVKAVLESCIAENEADRHVSNLKGIAVLTRIGANDRTIHPFLVRRMYRVLKEHDINVTYVELPGKEHWWWDTIETNDGGCVNDKQIRDFTNDYSNILSQSCDAEGHCSSPESSVMASMTSEPIMFTYTVMNPAFGGSMRGLQILQQIVPLRTSVIKVKMENGVITMRTENVQMMCIIEPKIRPVAWKHKTVKADGDLLPETEISSIDESHEICFCLVAGKWEKCSKDQKAGNRIPGTLGPARTVAEARFLIVTGTLGSEEVSQSLQEFAVYIANLFFLTADTYAPIIKDKDLVEDKADAGNLIILGNVNENSYAKDFLQQADPQIKIDNDNGLRLGKCTYSRYGLLSLMPHKKDGLALLLLGSDIDMMRQVVTLATPTIPPMTRSPFSNLVPDFVVIGEEFAAKGTGGYLCAGHFDSQWKLATHLVSCAHCL